MNDDSVLYILSRYEKHLKPFGFETKPFLIGWYNEKLHKSFHLKFSPDTLALNIINTPDMFKNTFLSFVKESDISFLEDKQDLLDESIDVVLNQVCRDVAKDFTEKHDKILKTVLIRDHQMDNVTRQPKVVVRTAGHVSGQVRYYQKMDVAPQMNPWPKDKEIFGCSLHHEFGGWFAFRGVVVFPDLKCPDLSYCDPPDPLEGDPHQIIRLLNEFNFHWPTWQFRDVIDVKQRYCRAFMAYLSLPPGEQRFQLVKRWRAALLGGGVIDVTNETDLFDWGMA